jgi:phytol kinase
MRSILKFFTDNTPEIATVLTAGPAGLAWAAACLWFAGYLRRARGVRTGFTRKVFHFLIFLTVSAIHVWFGLPAVCLFGGMTTLVIFGAVALGSGNLLYEAIAREKDAPHRTFYVVVPYVATLLGGVVSNMLFGPYALVGYLVTGVGDAIGEPVGTRYGRHSYRVPSLRPVGPTRTLEGSAAVLVACVVMLVVAVAANPESCWTLALLWRIPVIAMLCTLAEARSPHGIDNAVLMIGGSWLGWLML